jgi:hypothetical protein
LSRARWQAREVESLLPVDYHHVVFTLPHEVADLALANPGPLYQALFQAAAATLRDVAANRRWLGAAPGVLLVLHTWGQNLHHHPHVHGVVTGGGLSCDARGVVEATPRWVSCRPGFFLAVRVLSRVFRGKYLELLRRAFATKQLRFPGSLAALRAAVVFAGWLASLRHKEWVVYVKPPFGGPKQVLKYLARYTHRVAISNARLLTLADGRVTFHYRDYADGHKPKTMTVTADEFLRRFVQHVLPKGFVKIRHYGLLANRRREELLRQCRRLLLAAAVPPGVSEPARREVVVEPVCERCCPHCGSRRLAVRDLPREEMVTGGLGDTS